MSDSRVNGIWETPEGGILVAYSDNAMRYCEATFWRKVWNKFARTCQVVTGWWE